MAYFSGRTVQTANIADGSVTTAKIADGTILNADMSGTGSHFLDVKYKAVNEAVNNSSTMQNDDDLVSASLAASSRWAVDILIITTSSVGTTPDAKFDFTIPTGATLYVGMTAGPDTGDAFAANLTSAGNQVAQAFGVSTVDRTLRLSGWLEIDTTAGTCQLRWAQNVAAVEDTTFRRNSWMILRRLA